jgi:hypothetical protein
MNTKRNAPVKETKFDRVGEILVNGRLIIAGDIIKIHGEHGSKFRFNSLVTNKETGAIWIDCFEMDKAVASAWRSFRPDRIKLIPIKRGRKNVNRR